MVLKILQFFLCFTLLVGIHEFGHFIVARLFKIRVEKFYIFFDPWFSLFKFNWRGTEYGLGWLPLGGYVKIGGMIDESMDKEQMAAPVRPDDFRAKPAWQRFLVMIAGVTMNVLLAIAVYAAICFTWGQSYIDNDDLKYGYTFNEAGRQLGFRNGDRILTVDGERVDDITEIVNRLLITDEDRRVEVARGGETVALDLSLEQLIEMRREKGYISLLAPMIPFVVDSVASQSALAAGLQAGDRVVAVGGESELMDVREIQQKIRASAGDTLVLNVLRGEERLLLPAAVDAEGRIGVMLDVSYPPVSTRHFTLLESIPAGVREAGRQIADYWQQLKMIVKPQTKMYEELGGFIAIGSIFPTEWDWLRFWSVTAFLSVILAVMNILPIPGLDGGHMMFTLWEMVTGRKVGERALEIAQYIGMMILLVLLVYANGNDIYRLLFK